MTPRSGDVLTVGIDATWRSHPSHILGADLITGEVHDQRARVAGWAEPGADRSAWDPVRLAACGFDPLCAPVGPTVRRVGELRPVSMRELAPGRRVVGFGQPSNGWPG